MSVGAALWVLVANVVAIAVVVIVLVVVGHPWPLNLQHHSASGVDHAVDCSAVGEQSNVLVLVVVVDVLTTFLTAMQPRRRC